MRPLVVGLTGGIGAGKSTALRAFARAGCATLASDEVVHGLYVRDDVRAAVVERFGLGVLTAEGEVDRGRLGVIVFDDDGARRWLEALLHPLVAAELASLVERSRQEGRAICVHEVPLLFEAGLAGRYDRVVLVTASDEVRRRRSPARFDERARHQLPEQEKRRLADDVFDNDGTTAELEAWVTALVERLGATP